MNRRWTLLALGFVCLLTASPAGAQTPTPTPTPTATPEVEGVLPGNTGDFQICLYTGRRGNPYVLISILPERRADYESDPRNIIPAPPEGCPTRVRGQATPAPTPSATREPGDSEPVEDEPTDDSTPASGTGAGSSPGAAPLEPGLPGAPEAQAISNTAIPMTGSRPLETLLFGLAFTLIGAGGLQLLAARR